MSAPAAGHPAPFGPYERWMFALGKHYDLPALFLSGASHVSAVAELPGPVTPPAGMPHLWRGAGFATRFLPLLIGPDAAGRGLLAKSLPEVEAETTALGAALAGAAGGPARLRLNFPLPQGTLAPGAALPVTPGPRDPALGTAAPKVILAIIDHGIPFAHSAFRRGAGAGGTRIDWCWSQGAMAGAPGRVPFGRDFRRDEIDAALAAEGGDEEALYRAAGLLTQPGGPPMPLSRLTSHGAHCLDLLAGSWPEASAAQARIIAVDLPSSPVWETSGFGKDMFLLSALHYIFDRADRLRDLYGTPDLPLVVNLSFGHSGGAQDGQSLIEAALDEMIQARNALAPTVLVMPAGNTFHAGLFAHLTDAEFAAAPAPREARLHWFAPPDDRTSSFLELWYPPGLEPSQLDLDLATPQGAMVASTAGLATLGGDTLAAPITLAGRCIGQLSLDRARSGAWRVTICLAPTATLATLPGLGLAPSGIWTLTLRLAPQARLPAGGIQARIQRDMSYGQGQTGARQSRFLDDLDQPLAPEGHPIRQDRSPGAGLRRFGTLNGMAGAPGTLVVTGMLSSRDRAADYASAGLPGARPAVHLATASDTSPERPGRRAAGTRSGVSIRASGTSVASPLAARQLALLWLAQPAPAGGPGPDVPTLVAQLKTLPQAQAVPAAADRARLGEFFLRD